MAGVMAAYFAIRQLELWVPFPFDYRKRFDVSCKGVPPATVAEWTLQGAGNRDFYDGRSWQALWAATIYSIMRLQCRSSMATTYL